MAEGQPQAAPVVPGESVAIASDVEVTGAAGTGEREQHSLPWSTFLHLFPGLVLGAVIVLLAPVLERRGVDPAFVLFGGIGVVIVPLELGYLAVQAKRKTGSWSPLAVIGYRRRLPRRQLLGRAGRLILWFVAVLVVSIAVLDTWLADHVFGWLPGSILQFATMEGDELSGGALVALLVIAFLFNGILGPITEELYFRGHLLPRIDRLGASAPILNTALFALYHVWTPWRWPAVLIGFLPIARATSRERSIQLSIVVHVAVNWIFLLLLLAFYMGGS